MENDSAKLAEHLKGYLPYVFVGFDKGFKLALPEGYKFGKA